MLRWLWLCTFLPDLSLAICETPDNVSRWNAAWQCWDMEAAGYSVELPNPHCPSKNHLQSSSHPLSSQNRSFIHSEKRCNLFSNGHVLCSTFAFNFRSPLLSLWVSWLTNAPGPPPTRPPTVVLGF